MRFSLKVQIYPFRHAECRYIVRTIFADFLGIEVEIEETNLVRNEIIIEADGKRLVVREDFFSQTESLWGKLESLPETPLKKIKGIPVIYGALDRDCEMFDLGSSIIPFDLFGSCFFMLSRYEEIVITNIDKHARFLAQDSLAFREGFLNRPIVNEYVELLWSSLASLWPTLKRTKHEFKTIITHDVDSPFKYQSIPLSKIIRRCGGDLIKRRSITSMFRNVIGWVKTKITNYDRESHQIFELMMDVDEQFGLKGTFFFISDQTGSVYDATYDLFDPSIKLLMTRIIERGHEIGIHGSYDSYRDFDQFFIELERLKKICPVPIKGGRNHYLRFSALESFANWDRTGWEYDTTLSYADCAGFRCGTCYEFTAFDLSKRTPLRIKERPLIVMERSVMDEAYMGLGMSERALKYIGELKKECRKYNGNFVILWHNTRYQNKNELDFLKKTLSL